MCQARGSTGKRSRDDSTGRCPTRRFFWKQHAEAHTPTLDMSAGNFHCHGAGVHLRSRTTAAHDSVAAAVGPHAPLRRSSAGPSCTASGMDHSGKHGACRVCECGCNALPPELCRSARLRIPADDREDPLGLGIAEFHRDPWLDPARLWPDAVRHRVERTGLSSPGHRRVSRSACGCGGDGEKPRTPILDTQRRVRCRLEPSDGSERLPATAPRQGGSGTRGLESHAT